MAGEQFSLCWDNFHKNMSSGMHSLLESEDLVDVTLAVEGKYLKAHKMVLSVCSPYFRELFQSNPCKHPIVFMKDVSYVALSDLLTFMYQGEVQVNQENLATFIKTAEALQIKGLTGDGNGDVSEVPDESPPPEQNSKRMLHEIDDVQTPRAKKPMTYPTKRPKLHSVPETKIPKTETIALPSTPSTEQIIQFKMEPYESGDHSNIENTDDSQVDHFVDESVDDGHIDETEDYSMLEGEEEPQAGTSGDAVGDSQDWHFMNCTDRTRRKRKSGPGVRFVINGYVYHTNLVAGTPPLRYLGCVEIKKSQCKGRATLPVDGTPDQIRLTQAHNHPPDSKAEVKDTFMKELKISLQTMTYASCTEIYDTVAKKYPEGAEEIPYRMVCARLYRWKKNVSFKYSL